jgi:hypothetical protein
MFEAVAGSNAGHSFFVTLRPPDNAIGLGGCVKAFAPISVRPNYRRYFALSARIFAPLP